MCVCFLIHNSCSRHPWFVSLCLVYFMQRLWSMLAASPLCNWVRPCQALLLTWTSSLTAFRWVSVLALLRKYAWTHFSCLSSSWLDCILSICLSVWLADCLSRSLTGWLPAWLAGCLAAWLAAWLAGWLLYVKVLLFVQSCATLRLLFSWAAIKSVFVCSRHRLPWLLCTTIRW